jgi:hypothetical protein
MIGKFGNLGVTVDRPSRMPIELPGADGPLLDDEGNEAYIEFLPWDPNGAQSSTRRNNASRCAKASGNARRRPAQRGGKYRHRRDQAETGRRAGDRHLVDIDRKPTIRRSAKPTRSN